MRFFRIEWDTGTEWEPTAILTELTEPPTVTLRAVVVALKRHVAAIDKRSNASDLSRYRIAETASNEVAWSGVYGYVDPADAHEDGAPADVWLVQRRRARSTDRLWHPTGDFKSEHDARDFMRDYPELWPHEEWRMVKQRTTWEVVV